MRKNNIFCLHLIQEEGPWFQTLRDPKPSSEWGEMMEDRGEEREIGSGEGREEKKKKKKKKRKQWRRGKKGRKPEVLFGQEKQLVSKFLSLQSSQARYPNN